MNTEMKNVTIKSAKIAAATCVAFGAVAVMASGAALKAVAEGGKYLKNVIEEIVGDDDGQEEAEETG